MNTRFFKKNQWKRVTFPEGGNLLLLKVQLSYFAKTCNQDFEIDEHRIT